MSTEGRRPAEIERPLRLGELLAESIRAYGSRSWAFLGVGLVEGAAFLAAIAVPAVAGVAILSVAFVAAFAATARLVGGDAFGAAWRRVGVEAPVLVSLAFVVAVPFFLASSQLLLLVFSVGWLGLTGFAIPAAVIEPGPSPPGRPGRIPYALRRTVTLARADYIHALAVAAALVAIYLLVGILLAQALVSLADNGRLAALMLVQVVLAPFFFIGLSLLYFEQRVRAFEAQGREGGRREGGSRAGGSRAGGRRAGGRRAGGSPRRRA